MRTNRFIVAALAVLLSLPAGPPDQTELTQASNQNVLLISELQLPGSTEGIAVSGDTIYAAAGNGGLRIIDASDITQPHEVGFIRTRGSAKDVVLLGDYAFVAAGIAGLHVIDVSEPGSPAEVGFYDTPGDAKRVFAADDYVYIADGSGGLRVMDVTNPQKPLEVGYYLTDANDMEVVGQWVYLVETVTNDCEERGGVLRILDISNPASPVSIGETPAPDCHPYNSYFLSVAVEENYVYVGTDDRVDGSVNVYDSPSLIQLGDGYVSLTGDAQEVIVEDALVYVTSRLGGLYIVNFTVPTAPQRIGYYNTEGNAVDVAVANGFAYVADSQGIVILWPLFHPVYLPFVPLN